MWSRKFSKVSSCESLHEEIDDDRQLGHPPQEQVTRPWQDTTLSVAERVEPLLAGDDAGGEGRPARQPLGRQRHAGRRAPEQPADRARRHVNVAPLQDVFAAAGRSRWRRPAGTGSATSLGSSAACRCPSTRGRRRAGAPAARGPGGLPARHPGPRPRGVPHRVHHLRRDRLPGGDRVGRDLRPRPGRADGRRHRPRHGRASACTRASPRCSTSCATTAGAGSRRPSARTRTWSRCSAPPTCAVCRAPGVIATLKHFAGYSASRAARNHGPVPMGRRELLDVILPPFETAVAPAGAGSVMNSYSDVDGVPAGADPWLLTDLLRDEWGFEGTVVSDYWAVPFLAHDAPRRRRHRRGRRAGAVGRHRRRAARHPRLRRGPRRPGAARASSPRTSSTAPPAGCSRRRSSSGCSTRTGRPRAR